MVLLKVIKKFYFPDVISTYYLKNLLFWECERKDEDFWREDNSASCFLFMLDRLQECLEAHHLPHYVTPQSNLLMYEDPAKLNDAAVVVDEVRRNILPKTFSLLRRLQSLTYQSQTYLQNIGLQLEGQLLKMQESKEDHRELLRISSAAERQNIEKLINVGLYGCQSIRARHLCKLWLKAMSRNYGKRKRSSYLSRRRLKIFSLMKNFLQWHLCPSSIPRKELSSLWRFPRTSVMGRLREEQMKMALERTEEVKVSLDQWFQGSWRESGQESSENSRRHCGYQGRNKEGTRWGTCGAVSRQNEG